MLGVGLEHDVGTALGRDCGGLMLVLYKAGLAPYRNETLEAGWLELLRRRLTYFLAELLLGVNQVSDSSVLNCSIGIKVLVVLISVLLLKAGLSFAKGFLVLIKFLERILALWFLMLASLEVFDFKYLVRYLPSPAAVCLVGVLL